MTTPTYPSPLGVGLSQKAQQQLMSQRAGVLAPWFAALGNRHYSTANIVIIGDSQVEGTNLTQYNQRFSQRLVDKLRSLNPTNGVTTGGRGYIKTVQTQQSAGFGSTGITNFPCTISGVTSDLIAWGAQYDTTGLNNPGVAVTATFSLVGDSAKIMWVRSAFGGHFTWQVDSGITTTVNTGGTNGDGFSTLVSLGTAGAHTLTLAGVDNGFQAYVSGVVEYNGDLSTGIQVHECGHFGYNAGSWIQQTNSAQWPSGIMALNPNLIIINLGTNDAIINTPTQFQTNMATLIAAIRAPWTNPPPIVLTYFGSRGDTQTIAPWIQYISAGWSLALSDKGGSGGMSAITVHDVSLPLPGPSWQRMQNAPGTLGEWSADNIHPSPVGHSMVADSLAQFLMPW